VLTNLPDSVQEIADVIGRERALYLIGQLPRYTSKDHRWSAAAPSRVLLYVPKASRLTDRHKLVRILGWRDAVRLCEVFGGEILKPANCSCIYKRYRDTQILRLAKDGLDSSRISALIGVSASQVRLILQRISQEERSSATDDNEPYTTKHT
jgi:hypothetical protein